ncbi:DUF3515 domain-containing protein [Kocuria sp. cx-455]|uniref:DUF3515 domain-containing protein n=1 Tax=Kocuria sp. cx-455 TaxID=2771377 RepID=UPI0016861252|nr:DUF3515 domain-containing protein [Kocuria sp. cx-455]MBD2764751.1 DUF3515 domain-containing protein [Kocuria sp. cx-455]
MFFSRVRTQDGSHGLPIPTRRAALTTMTLGALLLTGCGSPVTVEGAPNNTDPACASAMLAMPETMGDLDQRATTSQGTTAYGDPSGVIVRCGVEPPAPTTDPCTNVNGVDWLISEVEGQENQWRAVSYGRSPAVEMLFDTGRVPSSTVIVEASSAVAQIPQQNACLSVADTLDAQSTP